MLSETENINKFSITFNKLTGKGSGKNSSSEGLSVTIIPHNTLSSRGGDPERFAGHTQRTWIISKY